MNPHYLLGAVFLSAVATFALRALPFLLVKLARRHARLLHYLGEVMPPGIMVILSLYCLSTLRRDTVAQSAATLAALILLLWSRQRWHRPVLSICLGLAVYVIGQSILG